MFPIRFYFAQVVWVETPSNPTMKVTDIQAVTDLAKSRLKDCIVVVDNTFMSSYFQVSVIIALNYFTNVLLKL